MTDDLVKRLRSRNVFAYPAEGQRLALLAEEAADRIEALTAEVERLRAALIRLRDCDWVITPLDRMDAVRDIALAALGDAQ